MNIRTGVRKAADKLMRQVTYLKKVREAKRFRQDEPAGRVLLFGYPNHHNMGDQAQTYCILQWLRENEPGYRIYSYPADFLLRADGFLLRLLRQRCREQDKIYLHSGYHITDLYLCVEKMHRKTLELFPEKTLVFFPQTIYFKDPWQAELSAKLYGSHAHVVLMCRDKISYAYAQELFPNCRLLLMPDIVTTLIGRFPLERRARNGVLLCMRDGYEALIRPQEVARLRERLETFTQVRQADTAADACVHTIVADRETYVRQIIGEFSQYRAIVTDRYHGTIFALTANTPVVVVPTTDHKVTSGVDWFPPEFTGYIHCAATPEEIETAVRTIFAGYYAYSLPDYFYGRYYQRLKAVLDGNDEITV